MMRSIEQDKGGCLNLGSPSPLQQQGEFQKAGGGKGSGRGSAHHHHHHRSTALGKPTPSKWDDAQKWLVNLSRGGGTEVEQEARDSNADDRRLIPPQLIIPNPTSSSEDEEDQGAAIINIEIETKKVVVDFGDSICVRDMGTEMTPIPSQEPSRSATPVRAPPRSHVASSAYSSPTVAPTAVVVEEATGRRRGENDEGHVVVVENRNLPPAAANNNNNNNNNSKLNPLETRALAWDEAERAKYMARFKRQEVKIQAWENHEKRKAEMEMKRMEAKAERMKSRAQEKKYTNRVASTRRVAEEKRGKAEAVLNEKAVKTCERADYIRRTGHLPSSFSSCINLPWSCCS